MTGLHWQGRTDTATEVEVTVVSVSFEWPLSRIRGKLRGAISGKDPQALGTLWGGNSPGAHWLDESRRRAGAGPVLVFVPTPLLTTPCLLFCEVLCSGLAKTEVHFRLFPNQRQKSCTSFNSLLPDPRLFNLVTLALLLSYLLFRSPPHA